MKVIYVGPHEFEYKKVTLPANVVVEVSDEIGKVVTGFKDIHEVKGEEKGPLTDFKNRLITENGQEKYICPVCEKEFETKRQLTAHRNGAGHR